MRDLVGAIPLVALALTAVAGAAQSACADREPAAATEDALYVGVDAPSCGPSAPRPQVWSPPQRLHQNACSSGQIAELVDAFTAGTALDIEAPAFASCKQCAFSVETDRTYGVLVASLAGVYELNYGGCIAQLSGDVSSRGCGASVQKSNTCLRTACEWCSEPDELAACNERARATTCADVAAAAACAEELTKPGALAERCAMSDEPGAALRGYLDLFCGA